MQTNPINLRAKTRVLLSLTAACLAGLALTAPSVVSAQDRRGDSQDGHSSGRSQDRRDDSHGDRHRDRDESRVKFTHSDAERHFDNGVVLRRGAPIADKRLDAYFPHHYYSYPHYLVSREPGRAILSPFSFYVGVFPPYIDRSAVIVSIPGRVFIDVPIYTHGDYQIYGGGRDSYYLNRGGDDNRWKDDKDLSSSVYDLEDTFRNEDIGLLAPLTDPGVNIAVFSKGHYQYSLNPNDYLDMTRDFLRSVHTTEFTAYRVHRKSSSVYQVFAKHTYTDQDGASRTVYQCIVLERLRNRWTITQIDSSPAHLNN
jgi:hypothetical protein